MVRCRCTCHRKNIDAIAGEGVDIVDPCHAALACKDCFSRHINPYQYAPPPTKPFEPPPNTGYDPSNESGEG